MTKQSQHVTSLYAEVLHILMPITITLQCILLRPSYSWALCILIVHAAIKIGGLKEFIVFLVLPGHHISVFFGKNIYS